MGEGLLSDLLKQMMNIGLKGKPQLNQNELVIEFTEEDFLEATTKNVDPRFKQSIKIEFQQGKMIIRIKLF